MASVVGVEPSSEEKPWLEWPVELPASGDTREEFPEFQVLNDPAFLRKVLGEVREKFFAKAAEEWGDACENGCLLLAGGTSDDFALYDSDTLKCGFRQESFFRYLFGLNEPDALGLMDLSKKEVVLFVPKLDKSAERWMGPLKELDWYQKRFAVDECLMTSQLQKCLMDRDIHRIFLLNGVNSDSGERVKTKVDLSLYLSEKKEDDDDYYYEVHDSEDEAYLLLSECRVIKTPSEITLLKYANLVSSKAHVYVMRHVRPGMMERQCEALFKAYSYLFGGSRHQSYECICCSGTHGSILHYGHAGYPNDRIIQDKDYLLLDLGSEYQGYTTDITCSFPVNGQFDRELRPSWVKIYQSVYDAQKSVMSAMKSGVLWTDMHKLAERVILLALQDIKVVNPTVSMDELMSHYVCSLFMPHGLGHLLGLNVHDVGGYTDSKYPPSKEPGLCWLRTTRALKSGMVITVEPGCYFNRPWIEQQLLDNPDLKKYVNLDLIHDLQLWELGGIRLEDDVVVLDSGIDNLTKCPRSIEDIEQVMSVKKLSIASSL